MPPCSFLTLPKPPATSTSTPQRPALCCVRSRCVHVQSLAAMRPRQEPLQRRQQRRQRWRQHSIPDPSRSPLFNSEIFMKEFTDMQREMQQLTGMIRNFGEFDLEGKKIFVDQLDKMADRMRVILARLKLSSEDDEFGKWVLQQQNVQMLNANTNWELILQGLNEETKEMRRMIELEESTADPQRLAMIREAWRQKFATAPQLTPEDLASDPELAEGAMHPDAMRAVTEVMADPSKLENWRSNPPLYKFVKRALQGRI